MKADIRAKSPEIPVDFRANSSLARVSGRFTSPSALAGTTFRCCETRPNRAKAGPSSATFVVFIHGYRRGLTSASRVVHLGAIADAIRLTRVTLRA